MAETPRPASVPIAPGLSLASAVAAARGRLQALGFYPTLFYGYMAVALVIFTFLVPPFQKSDEPSHYYRAVSLTNLDLVCSKDANGQYYFNMKQRYAGLPAEMHVWDVAFQYNKKFDLAWLRTDFSKPFFNETVPVYDTCNLPPVGYVPNALGILAGKPFQNPLIGFYLGRIFGALFFVGAIVLALRIVPERYKLLIYFYAAIPMVLHQVGAISYDAVHLSLFPLLFAYLAKFLTEEGPIGRRDLLIFMGLIWWTINVRSFAYYPLVLLYFLLPWQRVADPFRQYLRLSGAFMGFTAVTTGVFGLLFLTETHLLAPDAFGISASSQVKFVLGHPWSFLAASYRTLLIHGELLLRQGIGVFGWIDYAFNFVPYYVAVALVGVLALLHRRARSSCAATATVAGAVGGDSRDSRHAVLVVVRGLVAGGRGRRWRPPGALFRGSAAIRDRRRVADGVDGGQRAVRAGLGPGPGSPDRRQHPQGRRRALLLSVATSVRAGCPGRWPAKEAGSRGQRAAR